MAIETQAGTPAPAPNPANAIGNVVSDKPHPGVVAGQRARAGRADTLALIEAGRLDDVAAKPARPAAPVERAAPVADIAQSRAKPDEPAPVADPAEPDLVPDPETTRRQTMIQQAEKRSRDKISVEKRELEQRAKAIEAEWSPRVQAAEAFESLKAKAAKARSNPALLVDVFRALGYTDDHLEPAAQALYAHSKAGQADPARKQQAERMMRERESTDELEATKRRLDELEGKIAQKDAAVEFRQLQGRYLDAAVNTIDAVDAPTVKTIAAKNPAKLREALWRHTVELTAELDGEAPPYEDVITRYQAELDELGLRLSPTTSDPKTNNQPADKKPPAKTLSADLSTPRVPRDAKGGKDHRAETRRMIESGKLE